MMTGKISDADKIPKTGSKLNSNMVKISSSKSILSYQNGSALNVENRECTLEEGMPGEGFREEESPTAEDPPFAGGTQNLKSECLDLLRKKLISDWSLSVFSCDLENKLTRMEPIEISKERQSVVQKLVVQISQLSDAEKLLLYLKLPSSTSSPFDPLRQPLNPLGNRQEIQQTIVWIKTHLEEDSEISIPKQDVYDQYLKYCENVSMKPLSTADFGKVMKQVYPGVRPRRLGTRGNSRYCYSGMRNTYKLPTPLLPRSSTENSFPNDCANDGTSFLSADGNKLKKIDKSKRKWTSSSASCRNDKFAKANGSSFLGSDKSSACYLKTAKKSKSQKEEEEEEEEKEKEKMESANPKEAMESETKCDEDCSDNSFGGFDMECGLRSDSVPYLRKREEQEDSSSKSGTREDLVFNCRPEEKRNGFHAEETQINVLLVKQGEFGPASKEDQKNPSKKVDTTTKSNFFDGQISSVTNGFQKRKTDSEKQKTPKTKTKKSAKNFKKSYVPIQPKPAESSAKLTVRFEKSQVPPPLPLPLRQEARNESEGMAICEESDSQEPEEEIVRYFKHLDESDMSKANGLVEQAVKNLDCSGSVQINGVTQTASNGRRNPAAITCGKEASNRTNQQILRSQSCFEDHGGVFHPAEKWERICMPPRSQSSVALPTCQEMTDSNSKSDDGKKKKISHLRILLENSILTHQTGRNPYSNSKIPSRLNPVIPNAQSNNSVSGQVPFSSNESNFLVSNSSVEGALLKLNGLKSVSKGAVSSFASQSPNARTKNFNFTPISPSGPQSPLKQPPASPFISPGNTPVPRNFRQNSDRGDHFLSPSVERKFQGSLRSTEELGEVLGYDFSKNFMGNSMAKTCRSPTAGFLPGSRPRSYSSTNFYRSKTKKNSSKSAVGIINRTSNPFPKNQVQSIAEINFSPFASSQQLDQLGFVAAGGGEFLSNEVQKFLENNSKMSEDQVATNRSRSVPLNRMMGEGGWMPNQPTIYSGYFDLEHSTESGKLSEVATNSSENSPVKCATANLTANFATAGEMTSLGTNSLAGEMFTGDPTMVQYFSGDFQRSNEGTFSEGQSFGEESTFSNKLDLNSSGTFGGAFATDSDPGGIADNIKSYLPDFEGLDNKGLVEPPGDSTAGGEEAVASGSNDRKLFKSSLYEGGNDNLKDPVITSFKPVLMSDMSESPASPVLNFFGSKISEDSQHLIEFFDFED